MKYAKAILVTIVVGDDCGSGDMRIYSEAFVPACGPKNELQ
jgi:hypothetical protein